MSSEKKLSKRQARREQQRKREQRNRIITIVVIVVGALLVASALIYPNLKPVGEIATVTTSHPRPMPSDNALGDPNAPIKIEEFSDFQCPYCQKFYLDTEAQLISSYVTTGKVYFVYRSFGYFIGQESGNAAMAAYCAGDQNKFWEMHDILFANHTGENVGDFTDRRITAFAESIGLDMTTFNSCYTSGKYSNRIQQDFNDGSAYGVQATPSFVLSYQVNGQTQTKLISGAQPFSEFQSQIDAILTQLGQ